MSVDSAGMAARLGIKPGMVVQELGWDEDADEDLRDAVIELSGGEMVDEDTDEVADVVILWWREDDGDLVDALVDAIASLADDGVVWLLVPKSGRPGHVEPGDVTEAAPTAGLSQTSSISAAKDWSGIRLVTPKAAAALTRPRSTLRGCGTIGGMSLSVGDTRPRVQPPRPGQAGRVPRGPARHPRAAGLLPVRLLRHLHR